MILHDRAVLAPAYFILSASKENYFDIDEIIASDTNYLIGYAYNQENYRYLKWKTLVEKEQKDIWALGSSRVLQFVYKGTSFY